MKNIASFSDLKTSKPETLTTPSTLYTAIFYSLNLSAAAAAAPSSCNDAGLNCMRRWRSPGRVILSCMIKSASTWSWQDLSFCLFKCSQFPFNMILKNDWCLSFRYSHCGSLICQQTAFRAQHSLVVMLMERWKLMECPVLTKAFSRMSSNQFGKYRTFFPFC